MNSVIILSGPIGADKSTVAKELASLLPGPVANIEGDTFWKFIAKGSKSNGRVRNFKTIMASMVAAAVPYATAGYEVIVDFSMPPWFLDTARRIAKVRDIPLSYVVLRPPAEVCASRAAHRTEGAIADYTSCMGFMDLYNDFIEVHNAIIPDDMDDAATIAMFIADGLRKGSFVI
jgi:chloramphenicol 3-O-phosphotransferase